MSILNPIQPRMHCAKFGWNLPSSSGEKEFYISSMYFHYFVIISPWKRASPSFEQIWIINIQGCPCAKFWLKLTEWFWRKRWKCEKFTTTTTTTDNGHILIRKTLLSLRLRWAKIQCKFQALKGVSVVFFKFRFVQCGDIFVRRRQNVHQMYVNLLTVLNQMYFNVVLLWILGIYANDLRHALISVMYQSSQIRPLLWYMRLKSVTWFPSR